MSIGRHTSAVSGNNGASITITAQSGYNSVGGTGSNGGNIILQLGQGGSGTIAPGAVGMLEIVNATTNGSAYAGGGTLPATPLGFLSVVINNTTVRIPYYGNVP
jgi:hypothetical protein